MGEVSKKYKQSQYDAAKELYEAAAKEDDNQIRRAVTKFWAYEADTLPPDPSRPLKDDFRDELARVGKAVRAAIGEGEAKLNERSKALGQMEWGLSEEHRGNQAHQDGVEVYEARYEPTEQRATIGPEQYSGARAIMRELIASSQLDSSSAPSAPENTDTQVEKYGRADGDTDSDYRSEPEEEGSKLRERSRVRGRGR